MGRKSMGLILVLILIFIITGCSAKQESKASDSNEAVSVAESQMPAPGTSEEPTLPAQDRKIIQRLFYTIDTKTYTETLAHILTTMESVKGYVETMEQRGQGAGEESDTNRYGILRIRIPSESIKQFTDSFAGDATITSSRLETEDATAQFFDTEAHLKTLSIQEERLLKLLEQSTKLEDMIVLETRLSEVRYEIENLQGTLNRLGQLVAYSTVEIELYEVKDVLKLKGQKDSYGNRALETFMSSVQGVFEFVEASSLLLIGLLPLIFIAIPLFFLYRWLTRKFPGLFKKRSSKRTIQSADKDAMHTKEPTSGKQ